MLLIGMCTSLTKKPTKPMIRKPIIVADAIRANSFLSGFVHFFTRWIESCVGDVSVSRRRRGGGVRVWRDASRDGGSGAVVWWRGGRDAAGASRQSVFDAARRTLTNCLKGCTITALTSDIVAALSGRCGSLSLHV